MPIDTNATLELLRQLVAIDSVNPSLVPGARGEREAAEFLRDWLREQGIAAELQETAVLPGPSRPNVVATMGPRDMRPALAIVGHIDTVGAGDMPEPFTPRERDPRLYGRGALDIKCGVAAMCAAAAAIAREGVKLAKPLLIAGVVDEECNSIGAQAFVQRYTAAAAVVLEPTDLKLCIAHKGFAWFEVVTQGRAAHGSLPREGRDAIRMMGRVLLELDALDHRLASLPPHRWLGNPSVHASLITGGQELSSYPAECRLQVERRTIPGESDAHLEAEMSGLLDSLRAHDREFRASARLFTTRAPYEISPEASIAAAMAQAIHSVTGGSELCGMAFWTDTAILAQAGIPGVVFGPRGRGLHGAEEYVELESVYACAEVLRKLILKCCASTD